MSSLYYFCSVTYIFIFNLIYNLETAYFILMDVSNRLNLEKFVVAYVSNFFSLLKERGAVREDELYDELAKRVSETLKLDEKIVKYLEHPFHWTFFCDNNSSSPFELFSDGRPDKGETYIQLKKDLLANSNPVFHFSKKILDIYGPYLEARIERL